MAVPDGWPPARVSGCTEPGLQASSPAAQTGKLLNARGREGVPVSTRTWDPYGLDIGGLPSLAELARQTPGAHA
jgi:hypothetical protein